MSFDSDTIKMWMGDSYGHIRQDNLTDMSIFGSC